MMSKTLWNSAKKELSKVKEKDIKEKNCHVQHQSCKRSLQPGPTGRIKEISKRSS